MENSVEIYSALASAIIAGLALIISLVAIVLGEIRNAKQKDFIATQHALNERLLAREEQSAESSLKADLGARLIKVGRSNHRVKIWNQGVATARNVNVIIPEGTDLIVSSDVAHKFPMETMERYQSVELTALVHFGTAMKQPIEIHWDDDHQAGNVKTVYLTV